MKKLYVIGLISSMIVLLTISSPWCFADEEKSLNEIKSELATAEADAYTEAYKNHIEKKKYFLGMHEQVVLVSLGYGLGSENQSVIITSLVIFILHNIFNGDE